MNAAKTAGEPSTSAAPPGSSASGAWAAHPRPQAAHLKTRVPRAATRLVDRERLRRVLDHARQGAEVVLVTGPPGSGKTSLLADWAARTAGVVWVTLDAGDDVCALWSAVLAALEAAGVACPRHPPADGVGANFVATVVSGVAELDRPVSLVLDEVEHLRDPEALHSIDLLLRWAPPSLGLVLAGRREPALALGRLRLAGRLRELRARDLTFTRREAEELVAGHGVRIDGRDMDTVMRRTEGWAAGLRLAAMSLESAEDPAELLAGFAAAEHAVADYLVGELLTRQPPAVYDFLLRTSLCDELTPDLAAELSGRADAGEILEGLCRANALAVRLDGPGQHYRYHGMLRAYLQAELHRRQVSAAAELHRTAGRWYAARGEGRRGLEHAVAAGDVAEICALAEREGLALVLTGEGRAVSRLLDAAPAEAAASPVIGLVAAAAALERGDLPRAEAALERVAGEDTYTSGLSAALRLQRRRRDGDVGDALARLAGAGTSGDRDIDMVLLLARGLVQLVAGDLTCAETDLCRAQLLATDAERDSVALRCLATLAGVAVNRGELDGALGRAGATLDFAAERGWQRHPVLGRAHLAAGLVAHLRLDDAAAAGSAQPAIDLLDGRADPSGRFGAVALAAVAAFDARVAPTARGLREHPAALRQAWSAQPGRLEPALVSFAAFAQQRMCLSLGEPGWAAEFVGAAVERLGEVGGGAAGDGAVLSAVSHVHRGRTDQARRLLGPVLGGDLGCISPLALVEGWVLEAVLADAAADRFRAHRALLAAVRLAEPQGILRPFRNGGRAVRRLLAGYAGRFGHAEPFVRRLLAGGDDRDLGPTERLSGRELEVLAELPSLRTAEEIATDLGVSVNTVKTHMRSVYRKLQVNSRRDAVAAGRRHSLL